VRYYLRQQSTGEILRTTFDVYRRYFFTLVAIYMVPILPFAVWSFYLSQTTGETFNIAYFAATAIEAFPFLAITVAISEIALGNRPSLVRAYCRVFGRNFPNILFTYVLFYSGLLLAFVLFVVPALVYWALFMFTLVVVMIEGRTGFAAFARSKALGKGHYLRNILIGSLMPLSCLSLVLILSAGYGYLGTAVPPLAEPLSIAIFSTFLTIVLAPLVYTPLMLLYFDMRARKEAYDTALLTEDLLR
jgi:hypothetical protein